MKPFDKSFLSHLLGVKQCLKGGSVSRHPPLITDGAPAPEEEEASMGRLKSRRPKKENSRYIGNEWMA
jgi:hypothetical protein